MRHLLAIKKGLVACYLWVQQLKIIPIATLISSIVAVFALFYSLSEYKETLKDEQLSNRPQIGIIHFRTSYDLNPLRIVPLFTLKNVGNRICRNVKILSQIVSKDSTNKYSLQDQLNLEGANPILAGASGIDFGAGSVTPKSNTTYFCKIVFSYNDVISHLFYSDSFYYKWSYKNIPDTATNYREVERKEANQLDSVITSHAAD